MPVNSVELKDVFPDALVWAVGCIAGERPTEPACLQIKSLPYTSANTGNLLVDVRNADGYQYYVSLRDWHVKGVQDSGPIYNMHRWFLSKADAEQYIADVNSRNLPEEYLAYIKKQAEDKFHL